MGNDLISIIVPIYKVENYIKKCIDSIINQTYKNLEIILVDDGSPDKCGEICEEFAKKDSRIRVIHKENGGLSDARNAGIDVAEGKYIAFIDSDDYIHNEFIDILYKNIIITNADISICDFKNVDENYDQNLKEKELKNNIKCFSNVQALNNLYVKEFSVQTVVAWNKLYKASIWKDIRYPKGKIHEDEFVIHYLLNNAQKIVYTDEKLYYYLQRGNSITGMGTNIKTLDKFEAFENRNNYFKQNNYLELYNKALYAICASSRFAYIDTKNKDIKIKLNKIFIENYYKYVKLNVPFKNRIKMWIFRYLIFIVTIKKWSDLKK